MSGAASRRKGAGGELELVHILRDIFGYKVRRGNVFYHEPDIVGMNGVHIEVKRRERIDIWAAIRQSEEAAERLKDGIPTVFFRRSRSKWYVVIPLDGFVDMHGAWIDER